MSYQAEYGGWVAFAVSLPKWEWGLFRGHGALGPDSETQSLLRRNGDSSVEYSPGLVKMKVCGIRKYE